jgi:prefoldin subunit 4
MLSSLVVGRWSLVRVRVGDVFVHMTTEEARERTEEELQRAQAALDKMRQEFEAIQAEMGQLKVTLTAKFGDAINLETDEEKEARRAAQQAK